MKTNHQHELNKIQDQAYADHFKKIEKAAALVASLDEYDMIDFIQEVYMRSPNMEKLAEIRVAAKMVMEGIRDIEGIA